MSSLSSSDAPQSEGLSDNRSVSSDDGSNGDIASCDEVVTMSGIQKVIMREDMEVALDCNLHRVMTPTCKRKVYAQEIFSGGRLAVVSHACITFTS